MSHPPPDLEKFAVLQGKNGSKMLQGGKITLEESHGTTSESLFDNVFHIF